MNRPQRQHSHLLAKIAKTETITLKKIGKKAKRLKKWAAQYAPLAGHTPAES